MVQRALPDLFLEPERMARACASSFAHLDDAVFVIGRKPRTIVSCNRAAETMFGHSADELIGRDTSVLHVDQDHFEEFARRSAPELARTGYFRTEFEMRRRDGRVFETVHHVSLLEPDRGIAGGALSFVRDLSDLSRARRALEETQAHLLGAQRVAAAGLVQSMTVHDMNNLLTAGLGYLHVLLATELDSTQQRYAETARAAIDRASKQMRRLLALARPQGPGQETADANRVIEEMGPVIRGALGRSIEYRFEPDPDLCAVAMSSGELEQVVLNLAINAREAMRSPGHLVVRTRSGPGEAIISLADTGEGIPAELHERIFEPFYSTRSGRGGSGLGLAAVRVLVERSAGRIEVASTPGEGTTFTLHLPFARAKT